MVEVRTETTSKEAHMGTPTFPDTIGSRIRDAREVLGLNQDMFKVRLGKAGLTVSQGTLSKIESDTREVRLHEAPAICAVLGITLDYLAGSTSGNGENDGNVSLERLAVVEIRNTLSRLGLEDAADSRVGHQGKSPDLMSLEEVAEHLQIPVKTLYGWRTQGKGPRGLRVGKYVRYRREDVEIWLDEQAETGDDR